MTRRSWGIGRSLYPLSPRGDPPDWWRVGSRWRPSSSDDASFCPPIQTPSSSHVNEHAPDRAAGARAHADGTGGALSLRPAQQTISRPAPPPPPPPSLVEQALRLLDNEGGLSGIPATLPNNHANWTQALVFLAILRRGSEYPRVAAGFRQSAFVDADGTLLICGKPSSSLASFGVWRSEQPEHSNASRMSRRRACAVGRCSPPPHHRPLCQWQSLQLGSWLSRLSRPTRAR